MRIFLQSVLLLLPLFLCAQIKTINLDPVTVTSSLAELQSSKTGRNIVIIEGALFAKMPIHSIDELLRYIPGVEVQMRGPMGAQSDIVLRGGTFQQVLILVDGVRVNDPNTGHFNSYIPIVPEEIERVEVLKGASSAIYGSEAVGGVIHIISKSFSSGFEKNKELELSAQAGLGEYNLVTAIIGGNYKNAKTKIGGGLLFINTDGQLQRGTRGFLTNSTTSFSVQQKLSEHIDFKCRTALDERDFSAQNFYTTFLSDTAQEKVKTLWNQAGIHFKKGQEKIDFNASLKKVEDVFTYNSGAPANKNKSNLLQLLAIYEHTLASKGVITTGVQYQDRKIVSNDRGNHSVKQAASFFIINYDLLPSLMVSPAMRLDWDERAGTELIPQINISYKTNSVQLRGSAGKTIRTADFTERYNNYNKTFVASGSIGNPALAAERSFSYEAGADYFLNSSGINKGRVSATVFQRFHSDLIDWVVTPYSEMPRKDNLSPGGSYALSKNIRSVTTSGVETDFYYSIQVLHDQQISGTLGLVWLQSNSTEKSFYISSHANFLANISVQWQSGRFGLAVNGIYKSREGRDAAAIDAKVSPEYFIVNMRADVKILGDKAGVYIQGDNVFDKNYQDLLGSVMPGRWLSGGVRLNINSRKNARHM